MYVAHLSDSIHALLCVAGSLGGGGSFHGFLSRSSVDDGGGGGGQLVITTQQRHADGPAEDIHGSDLLIRQCGTSC